MNIKKIAFSSVAALMAISNFSSLGILGLGNSSMIVASAESQTTVPATFVRFINMLPSEIVRVESDDGVNVFDVTVDWNCTTSFYGYGAIIRVPAGHYIVREIKAPEGYTLSQETFEFDAVGERVTIDMKRENICNMTPPISEMSIVNVLQGAKMELTSQDGSTDVTFTVGDAANTISGKNAGVRVLSESLNSIVLQIPRGHYVLREITAPVGYTLSNDKYEFDVQAQPFAIEIKRDDIANIAPTLTPVCFINMLPSEELCVESDDGVNVFRVIPDENFGTSLYGYGARIQVPAGHYTVREVKAPEGFMLSQETFEFTATGEPITIDIKRSEIPHDEPTPPPTFTSTDIKTICKGTGYTEKAVEPIKTIELKDGTVLKLGEDFTVNYSNNINVGKANAKIYLTGNLQYTESKDSHSITNTFDYTFTIYPSKQYIQKINGVKRGFFVDYLNKSKSVGGYEVRYSTSSNFANASHTYVKYKTRDTATITGLKNNATYYVKVRSYKTISYNGVKKTIWGYWSPVKTVKTL